MGMSGRVLIVPCSFSVGTAFVRVEDSCSGCEIGCCFFLGACKVAVCQYLVNETWLCQDDSSFVLAAVDSDSKKVVHLSFVFEGQVGLKVGDDVGECLLSPTEK